LVLAIGYFVKYAIDNNWVGPIGRVGIGILCGGILIGVAHWLRNTYKAFSSVLAGGGLAIFYFTITLAFQEFHLFSQLTALVILSGITVFAVLLSLLYDKQELAVIALIGGFASPFLLSNGSANYSGLFMYLLILNVGLLIIAYFKAWRILNISAFALSVIVLATIMFALSGPTYSIGLTYASIFYLLFFTINIINNIRENKQFLAIDFSILLINTALYFSAGLYLLTAMGLHGYLGLFSASLAALNLVLSFILFRNKKADPNVLYLLIGITLTFISLTAPLQLHGHHITLFWASEAVLLFWLSQKSGIQLMKLTALIVWLAMITSLVIDLIGVYGYSDLRISIIANRGFITLIVASLSSYLLYVLLKKEEDDPEVYGFSIRQKFYGAMALILLFLSGALEINHQFSFYYPDTYLNVFYLMLYVPIFVYLVTIVTKKINGENFNWNAALTFLCCTIIAYILTTPLCFDLLSDILVLHKVGTSHLLARWLSDAFIGLIFYQIFVLCRDNLNQENNSMVWWLLTIAVVIFLSFELCFISTILFHSKANTFDVIRTVYIKTTLPVLWGVLSFVLMWLGMRNKQRNLRIISLTLFTITLIKLFFFDIIDIPRPGKIAAFLCLGVLLLIISFMYQKVKKSITDDKDKPKD